MAGTLETLNIMFDSLKMRCHRSFKMRVVLAIHPYTRAATGRLKEPLFLILDLTQPIRVQSRQSDDTCVSLSSHFDGRAPAGRCRRQSNGQNGNALG